MYDSVKKIVEEVPEDMTGMARTPAAGHLFTINENCEKLSEKMVQGFHHVVARLLYLCRRTRKDIQTAVEFLCTCVKKPRYRSHVIQYLRGTKDLMLMIKPAEHPRWWVDSSYGVHPDMRSHSGICMTFGKGVAYSESSKQKLNTKSSTEAELVAIDDGMGHVLWMNHFLAEQGQ